jgi:probable rRNA maturation factor
LTSARVVEIVNETAVQVNEELLGRIAEAALASEDAEGQVVIALVEPHVIEELNVRYRDVEGPTDILSFPAGDDDEWPAPAPDDQAEAAVGDLGELVVAPEIVRQYAAEERNSWDRQLAWTVLHGILHLLGHDHDVDEGDMRAREQRLLRMVDPLVREEGSVIRPPQGASPL